MRTMKLFAVIAALAVVQSGFAQTWKLDKAHARLGFDVTHLMVSDVEGGFKTFDITVTSSKDDFTDAQIDLTADVNSISTDNEKRDGHLKSPDFFDAAKYGTLSFKSTSLKKVGDKTYKLSGNLTMHGVTKPVELDVTLTGTTIHPMSKKHIAGFKITGVFKRSDFGIGASTPTSIVSDEVTLNSSIEVVKD